MGDDLAARVIQSLPDYQGTSANSVWLNFEKDPRYHGPLAKPDEVLNAAMLSLDIDGKAQEDLTYLEKIIKKAHASRPHFFVTWERLGVRAINRLFAHRIYPAGLTDNSKRIDGRVVERKLFFLHDLGHARLNENIINSSYETTWGVQDNFSKTFYKQFDYDSIMGRLSDSDKVLFDLAYFLYFHEVVAVPQLWGYGLAQIHASGNPTIEALQKIYKNDFYQACTFDFHNDGTVTARLQQEQGYTEDLIDRFLDKGDLWVNLPPEIKDQIKASPANSKEILASFLSEMFNIFFNLHYALARKVLGLA